MNDKEKAVFEKCSQFYVTHADIPLMSFTDFEQALQELNKGKIEITAWKEPSISLFDYITGISSIVELQDLVEQGILYFEKAGVYTQKVSITIAVEE
jgi:hypothetical protein